MNKRKILRRLMCLGFGVGIGIAGYMSRYWLAEQSTANLILILIGVFAIIFYCGKKFG